MRGEYSYPIPRFFRLLIIDDQIAASVRRREFFRNIFTAMVLECCGKEPLSLENIEIIIEGNPAQGFKRWQDEPFDLTLIDADFSTNRTSGPQHTDDLSKYILNSREQGFHIFTLLKTKVAPTSSVSLSFREKVCPFYLWTALSWEDKQDHIGLNTLLKRFNIDKENVIHKTDALIDSIIGMITPIVQRIQQRKFTSDQSIERLLFALRKNYGGICRDIIGGCLVKDEEQQYPFLPVLGQVQEYEKVRIRLCGAHIPKPLLDKPYFPLQQYSTNNVVDVIAILRKGKVFTPIAEYRKALQNRYQSLQHSHEKGGRLPWYPAAKRKGNSEVNVPAFIAAATPLTGISVVGGSAAIVALVDKVEALLQGPFDKVILKTTYLDKIDQWENTWWPSVQVQSHMRSRCLYPDTGSPTLWNSGKTAMETLPPQQMNLFLKEVLSRGQAVDTERVVVSLGSKYPMGTGMARIYGNNVETSLGSIWQRLFGDIFNNLPYETFPFVEINVRHFLREIVQYHLGGDEYLTPRTLNEKASPEPKNYWKEFRLWLGVVHQIGVTFKKKVILKLPYRSDVLAHVECIVSLREHHLIACHGTGDDEFGVRGMTVVNALKTPVPRNQEQVGMPYTPAWYANPDSWKDAKGKLYQMSGRFVSPYRNQILGGLVSDQAVSVLRELGLEVWISGGLTSQGEVKHCQDLEKHETVPHGQRRVINGIQIGTWALLATDLKKNGRLNWSEAKGPSRPAEPGPPYRLDVLACDKQCCDTIHIACPHDALAVKEKGQKVVVKDPDKCRYCTTWTCLANCKSKKLYREIIHLADGIKSESSTGSSEKAFLPRFSFLNVHRCQACGRCSQTFYCDSFIDRVNTNLPPLMDSRYCSGCGLCVQLCSSGALQLYPPKNFLVLLSSSRERKEILDSLHIPHLQYHPEKDLANFPQWIREALSSESRQLDVPGLNSFWDQRIQEDKFMLHQNEPELYPEKRKDRKKRCVETAKKLLDSISYETTEEQKETIQRAVIWSQLIWSDPGQVLWDCFLLSIQSVVMTVEEEQIVKASQLAELHGRSFIMRTWVVLLRQGNVLLNEKIDSEPLRLPMDETSCQQYDEQGFGCNRAAGLDLRACGKGFVELANDSAPKPSDIIELAGLPWEKIKNRLSKNPAVMDNHIASFARLDRVVK
jgi:NAD-dependent dihydropyrimidine dehydrogenase PreA subunit/predicted house-cleaning NTP pyrophosphatase (Maf/HAM1 superfamily)